MTAVYLDLLVLALALAIDLLFGEPPARIHPTVLIGKTISAAERRAPAAAAAPGAQVAYGVAAAAHAAAAAALMADRRPALAFVCNPNNPTGALLAPPEIEALASAVAASGTLLVVDEAYHPLSTGHAGSGAVALAAAGESVVALRSMTKDYALAGLRLGYAVAGVRVVRRLQALQPDWSVNSLAQAAGLAALADRDYPKRARAAVAEARAYVQHRLGRLGIRCYLSTANFVLAEVGDAAGLRGWLARQGLFVRDCTSFGLPDCIRIGLRPVADCSRLIDALTTWRSGTTPRP